MLINFSVSNYLSFAKTVKLDMTPTPLKENRDTHIQKVDDKLELLKGSVIYGANASGKSNLLKAVNFLKELVIYSLDDNEWEIDKFAFDIKYKNLPSLFEIEIAIDNEEYRFGCEINSNEIIKEWLFRTKANKNTEDKEPLYTRDKQLIACSNDFKEGHSLDLKTRPNTLFLTVCAKFNGIISTKIFNWFENNFDYADANRFSPNYYDAAALKADESIKRAVSMMLKQADVQIEDIKYEKNKDLKTNMDKLSQIVMKDNKGRYKSNINELLLFNTILTLHKKYNDSRLLSNEMCELPMYKESEGTRKLFGMAFDLMHTIGSDKTLLIDEWDSKIHPLVSKNIIEFFMKNAQSKSQIIFTTHDTSLMTINLFRRDQIWFTEKNQYGATDLYSLSDFKIRNDAAYGRNYILGKYGAIPFIGDFNSLLLNGKNNE
ncbi:MAG: ATP-binding protein [Elusimicrobiota bacterium]|jgi:AAA15 family ATPase/GTPase|nr:ATP-binding protein [Elusimicrobiota bacterium]